LTANINTYSIRTDWSVLILTSGANCMSTSKEKILESARDLFHLNGYNNTSVDDLLKNIGVTKSNFYYHFKSKEELGLIILEKRIEDYEIKFLSKTLGNKSVSPEKRLKKYYKEVTTYHKNLDCRRGCPFGNLALEMSDSNENFRLRLSKFFEYWQKIIEGCIKEGIKKKEFRDDLSYKSISQLILSHLEGAILIAKTQRSLLPLSRGSKTILKLLKPA
jgi:TetR/AcrR family transcriptional regulator, transcriptional repressor for nem operon